MFAEAISKAGKEPTRTEETAIAYVANAACVVRSAQRALGGRPTLLEVVRWFTQAHRRYTPSTIRQYKASLKTLGAVLCHQGKLAETDLEALLQLLESPPQPMTNGPKRTSARKQRSIRPIELRALIMSLRNSDREDDAFLAEYIGMTVMVFPRPIEWANARRDGQTLVLVNAKSTNGRAHGPTRTIELPGMSRPQLEGIDAFLAALRTRADAKGSWASFHRWLARQLRAACIRAGIAPLAPYSLRHLGMASAKKLFDAQTVAYLAGHACDRTASSHYAPARSGLKGVRAVIAARPENVALVRVTGRASRREHLARREHTLHPPRPFG